MRAALAALAAGLTLTACATREAPKPAPRPVARPSAPAPPASRPRPPSVETARPETGRPYNPTPWAEPQTEPTLAVSTLPGWAEEDHKAALAAFQAGCSASRGAAIQAVCARARAMGRAGDAEARAFFERNFVAVPVGGDGVLTAYFAPEYEARATRSDEFSAPVRPRPIGRVASSFQPYARAPAAATSLEADNLDELIDGVLQAPAEAPASPPPPPEWVDLAQADRATIERSAPAGALAWMRPEDLFFLQIQGSGILTFPDGRRLKALYAGDNGKPFVAIARPMVERGLFKSNGASGDAIRAWLAANRGPKADAVMQLNPRYIFFNLVSDDGQEPAGAAGVPLPAGRAIAVDPSRHAYGELFWIDAKAPTLAGAHKVYRRLAMALDTGSAIRGEVRADLYIGRGDAAGMEAGRVRHTLRMVRLEPVDTSRSARRETDAPARGG